MKLGSDFFQAEVVKVARNLIGCRLVRDSEEGRTEGVIIETEAYGSNDRAAHGYGGRRTKRNEPLFQAGGIAHVYLIYGRHHCLNLVTGPEGEPAAVLIRALEITGGRDLAARRRYGLDFDHLTPRQRQNLADGPGKVCRALAINMEFDGRPLTKSLYVRPRAEGAAPAIVALPRIGIDYAGPDRHLLWRFKRPAADFQGG